jgi:two-component system, chemotaxis family, protein-glutamate methylesterase/glutaminase
VVMLVLHRPWESESQLRHVLAQDSPLPVQVARHLVPMAPAHVYLGEPSRHLKLGWRGRAELVDDPDRVYANRTVDLLFDSLAERGAARTIGVILSGSLADGSSGLCALKSSGGLAMIVPPEESGMARSAAAHVRAVDFIGSPTDIGGEKARIVREHPYAKPLDELERAPKADSR